MGCNAGYTGAHRIALARFAQWQVVGRLGLPTWKDPQFVTSSEAPEQSKPLQIGIRIREDEGLMLNRPRLTQKLCAARPSAASF